MCANGAMFRKDIRGFLPELMEKMYGDRVVFKKKMIQAKKEFEKTKDPIYKNEIARCHNIQMAKKLISNDWVNHARKRMFYFVSMQYNQ